MTAYALASIRASVVAAVRLILAMRNRVEKVKIPVVDPGRMDFIEPSKNVIFLHIFGENVGEACPSCSKPAPMGPLRCRMLSRIFNFFAVGTQLPGDVQTLLIQNTQKSEMDRKRALL